MKVSPTEKAESREAVVTSETNESGERAASRESMRLMRPADIVLAAVLIAIGFLLSFFVSFGGDDGQQVKVSVAGEPYGIYYLHEDRDVEVRLRGKTQNVDADQETAESADQETTESAGASNCFRIKDGKVKMIDANCRGGDCLHEGEISKTGETIICLPNKVVIEIIGGEEDFDAISK